MLACPRLEELVIYADAVIGVALAVGRRSAVRRRRTVRRRTRTPRAWWTCLLGIAVELGEPSMAMSLAAKHMAMRRDGGEPRAPCRARPAIEAQFGGIEQRAWRSCSADSEARLWSLL
ncbi:hypothetical protein ACXX9E_29570 [Pseudomonas sp. GNP014]